MRSNKEFNPNLSNSAALMNAEEHQSIDRSRRAFLGALSSGRPRHSISPDGFCMGSNAGHGPAARGKGLIVGRPVPLTAETPLQSITDLDHA